jgi:hypothetical protein
MMDGTGAEWGFLIFAGVYDSTFSTIMPLWSHIARVLCTLQSHTAYNAEGCLDFLTSTPLSAY